MLCMILCVLFYIFYNMVEKLVLQQRKITVIKKNKNLLVMVFWSIVRSHFCVADKTRRLSLEYIPLQVQQSSQVCLISDCINQH